MLTITKRKTKIGPGDHGRKMSLKDFEFVETEEGYHYELSRGFITVLGNRHFPPRSDSRRSCADHLVVYQIANPDMIFAILGAWRMQAAGPCMGERTPSRSLGLPDQAEGPRKTASCGGDGCRSWRSKSFPALHRSRLHRQAPGILGSRHQGILDRRCRREQVVILRRGKSDWIEKRIGPAGVIATKLLPGFALPFQAILEAAAEAGMDEE